MTPTQKQCSVEPRSVKSKFLSILFGATMLVSLTPFQLSAQETRKDAVVKLPPALEAAIAESHGALRKILNGDPSGYAALFADRDDITLGNPQTAYWEQAAILQEDAANENALTRASRQTCQYVSY